MIVWTVLGWVISGALAVAVIVAVLFHRARKEIDLVKFDTERL